MSNETPRPRPCWSPLPPHQRRAAGVLIEKAKTTPDAYPLSLNAVRTACNQKSNRDPVMQLDADAVQRAIDALREKGAAMETQSSARVPKYRHLLYDWLGVDKVEIAVIAELLLRGPQTEGELRARAARMEPIPDLAALRPIVARLTERGLVLRLTPEGRGHIVTHGLYPPSELERIKADYAAPGFAGAASAGDIRREESPAAAEPDRGTINSAGTAAGVGLDAAVSAAPASPPDAGASRSGDRALSSELPAALASAGREIDRLKSRLEELTAETDERLAALEHAVAELGEFRERLEG